MVKSDWFNTVVSCSFLVSDSLLVYLVSTADDQKPAIAYALPVVAPGNGCRRLTFNPPTSA